MNHFLEISQLNQHAIEALIARAFEFKYQHVFPHYAKHPVAHLFYENSTRTRVSFEMAANHLAMPVINLDLNHSSESKGETIEDTLHNLAAMGIHHFVIRHQQNGLQQMLANQCDESIRIINAGDGSHAHPSQALLDMMTILEHKTHLSSLKIAVLGNISHSRVANSFQAISKIMGVGELTLVSPAIWQPKTLYYGWVTEDIREGLSDADVIICLRVQRERLAEDTQIDLETYRHDYALTSKSLAFAKKDAVVLHPGPMNRGIEIDSDVADGPQSLILKQVTNGVFARMAILDSLIADR